MQSDATALADAIRVGDLTASEAMQASFQTAEHYASFGSITHCDREKGVRAAADFDAAHNQDAISDNVVFGGVPTLAKDLGGPFKGFPVRAGSQILPEGDGRPDSVLATRFRKAGFCPFGLSTSPEFGLSLASEPAIGPICRNPLNPDLTPGGSSGGAAAAVAAGIVAIAHATDAGGSIRVPAACCGLVGLKPGRGTIPGGPNFGNHLGGIASELAVCRSVRDTQLIFDVLSGDVRGPSPPVKNAEIPTNSLRIGLLTGTGEAYPTSPERSAAVESAALLLESDGHRIIPVKWERFRQPVDDSANIFAGLINTNLAELAETSGLDFSRAELITQAAVERGQSMSATDLWQLMNAMVLVSHVLWQLFEEIDCLLTPMLSSAPRTIGEFPTDHRDIDLHFHRMTSFAPLAALANISGMPAITLPIDKDTNGLPLPIQLLAPMGCEKLLIALGLKLETDAQWHHRYQVAGLEQ